MCSCQHQFVHCVFMCCSSWFNKVSPSLISVCLFPLWFLHYSNPFAMRYCLRYCWWSLGCWDSFSLCTWAFLWDSYWRPWDWQPWPGTRSRVWWGRSASGGAECSVRVSAADACCRAGSDPGSAGPSSPSTSSCEWKRNLDYSQVGAGKVFSEMRESNGTKTNDIWSCDTTPHARKQTFSPLSLDMLGNRSKQVDLHTW